MLLHVWHVACDATLSFLLIIQANHWTTHAISPSCISHHSEQTFTRTSQQWFDERREHIPQAPWKNYLRRRYLDTWRRRLAALVAWRPLLQDILFLKLGAPFIYATSQKPILFISSILKRLLYSTMFWVFPPIRWRCMDRKREKKTVGVAFLNRKLLPVSSAGEQSRHRPPRASKLIYQWSLDYTILTTWHCDLEFKISNHPNEYLKTRSREEVIRLIFLS